MCKSITILICLSYILHFIFARLATLIFFNVGFKVEHQYKFKVKHHFNFKPVFQYFPMTTNNSWHFGQDQSAYQHFRLSAFLLEKSKKILVEKLFGKFPLFLLNLGKRNKINHIYSSTIVNFKANFYIFMIHIKKQKQKTRTELNIPPCNVTAIKRGIKTDETASDKFWQHLLHIGIVANRVIFITALMTRNWNRAFF